MLGSGFIWPPKEAILQHSITTFCYSQPWAIPLWAKKINFQSWTPQIIPKPTISTPKRDGLNLNHFHSCSPGDGVQWWGQGWWGVLWAWLCRYTIYMWEVKIRFRLKFCNLGWFSIFSLSPSPTVIHEYLGIGQTGREST